MKVYSYDMNFYTWIGRTHSRAYRRFASQKSLNEL